MITTHHKVWDDITYPFPNNFGNEEVMSSHTSLSMLLLIRTDVTVKPFPKCYDISQDLEGHLNNTGNPGKVYPPLTSLEIRGLIDPNMHCATYVMVLTRYVRCVI